ncbi:hypothetical protein [Rhizobium leguminosarum]|uniref:hypothetical protein n=1 Tax=Rhizobium leguminosarum TaxID=384 RepID=UPI001AE32C55|nr:hypothetical protein [Rhizobium leguminosarum]MBP2445957.1 hypothetical protein [Rhizobium leguminosarum]
MSTVGRTQFVDVGDNSGLGLPFIHVKLAAGRCFRPARGPSTTVRVVDQNSRLLTLIRDHPTRTALVVALVVGGFFFGAIRFCILAGYL